MLELATPLKPLDQYRQFILYRLVYNEQRQKFDKFPINPHTKQPFAKGSDWQRDPSAMSDFATAASKITPGDGYGVGFLFTPNDPFYFVDIDNCLEPCGTKWSALALELMAALPGAAVEVSASGRGLHIFGTGRPSIQHANKNTALGLELYTQWRFVALTGAGAIGDASTPAGAALDTVAATWFPASAAVTSAEWTSAPVEAWSGPADDDTLIASMLAAHSHGGAAVFGGMSGLAALWQGDADALGKVYPDNAREYDASSADAALAQHLAYWTGNDCERIVRLMWRSGLVRDKWQREDYLVRTVLRAVALQTTWLADPDITRYNPTPIDAGSDAQRQYAEQIRAAIVSQADEATAAALCGYQTSAKFWLDNRDAAPEVLLAALKPIDAPQRIAVSSEPEVITGYQFLTQTGQIEHFAGCVYVTNMHRVFTPSGDMLTPQQFNAVYGGYTFQTDEQGKTTRKAFDAFTESQVIRFPKAPGICFYPDQEPGAIVMVEGTPLLNVYTPLKIDSREGDVTPFLDHMRRLLPDERDRAILLAYMAACVQHKGVKFQWAPLVQGAEGNGKTLLTRVVARAIGKKYTHYPKASELDSKFNGWMLNKLFIGVEDVFVPENRRELIETLKPMITGGDGLEIQMKGADQITADVCCNFMLNSNHRDAIRKTRNDRRFAVFYTAQQSYDDIVRDGMAGDYFGRLYDWLNDVGYAYVTHYLTTYKIPDELNPAKGCHRAPVTSSTGDAIENSLGAIEQEIREAIEEGRRGFAGGFVSSVAIERLLRELRAERVVPQNRRRELMEGLGYVYHPALKDGRVHNPIAIDDNKKPRLYVKADYALAVGLTRAVDVVKMYIDAQAHQTDGVGKAAEVFG